MRELFLGLAALFLLLFGGLTLYVIVANGLSFPTLLGLLILVMLGIGVVGALRNPPEG